MWRCGRNGSPMRCFVRDGTGVAVSYAAGCAAWLEGGKKGGMEDDLMPVVTNESDWPLRALVGCASTTAASVAITTPQCVWSQAEKSLESLAGTERHCAQEVMTSISAVGQVCMSGIHMPICYSSRPEQSLGLCVNWPKIEDTRLSASSKRRRPNSGQKSIPLQSRRPAGMDRSQDCTQLQRLLQLISQTSWGPR